MSLSSRKNETTTGFGSSASTRGFGSSKNISSIGGSGGNDKEKKITPISKVDLMLDGISILGRCISIWHSHRMNVAHDPYSLDLVLQDVENSLNNPFFPTMLSNSLGQCSSGSMLCFSINSHAIYRGRTSNRLF
ncbi:hypothetical protein Tco_1427921 [Tanacetum coccineum]